MANLKLHLAGNTKTKNGKELPICGKVSLAIEYDTLLIEKFKTTEVINRCKNCNNILNNN